MEVKSTLGFQSAAAAVNVRFCETCGSKGEGDYKCIWGVSVEGSAPGSFYSSIHACISLSENECIEGKCEPERQEQSSLFRQSVWKRRVFPWSFCSLPHRLQHSLISKFFKPTLDAEDHEPL